MTKKIGWKAKDKIIHTWKLSNNRVIEEKEGPLPDGATVVISMDRYVLAVLPEIKDILLTNSGDIRVVLYDKEAGKKFQAPRNMWISREPEVLGQIKELAGSENVRLVV